MCSTSSVSITQDRGSDSASVAAHELGHNMNMVHDDAGRYSLLWTGVVSHHNSFYFSHF